MRKRLFFLLLTVVLLAPAAAQAQTSITMADVGIDLWPEYDRPGVLVIYRLTISTLTALPVDLSVRIPAAAGEPFAVAGGQTEDSLFNIPYTRLVLGDWASINFTADVSTLQIEYYDPALQISERHRQYDFVWPGDYSTEDLSIQIQQPFDASAMRISPSFGAGILGGNGLTYYNLEIGQLNAGQSIEISMEYDKASDIYSAENMPVQPSGDVTDSDDGSSPIWQTILLVFVGLIGIALIVNGVVLFLHSGRQHKTAFRLNRHKPAMPHRAQSTPDDGKDRYCHKCGKRAQSGDRFCRSCGAPLRTD